MTQRHVGASTWPGRIWRSNEVPIIRPFHASAKPIFHVDKTSPVLIEDANNLIPWHAIHRERSSVIVRLADRFKILSILWNGQLVDSFHSKAWRQSTLAH